MSNIYAIVKRNCYHMGLQQQKRNTDSYEETKKGIFFRISDYYSGFSSNTFLEIL